MTMLKGITWDHPRGYQGLERASEAFMRLRPDIAVHWERHSLHHFEFHPVAALADTYDLIVLDHPCIGEAAAQQCLVNLLAYQDELELEHLVTESAGRSFESYRYGDGLWALPLDAACQVAVARPDLLERVSLAVPRTLQEVHHLASVGKIGIAFKGVHALMVFFTLCANLRHPPFQGQAEEIDRLVGERALATMQELRGWCVPEVVDWNPIALLNAMQERDDLLYCPYVFGYASYSRREAGKPVLRFDNIPGVDGDSVHGAVLGGTGLAISRTSARREAALSLAGFLMQREVQVAMALHLGQPARRSAWQDETLNQGFNEFYRRTLPTLEAAYLRPRHPGYLKFQWEGGQLLETFLREKTAIRTTLEQLNALHRRYLHPH